MIEKKEISNEKALLIGVVRPGTAETIINEHLDDVELLAETAGAEVVGRITQKVSKIITFTGHNKNNPLSKLGDINFWIDNKAYNFVENIHQVWLLTIADLVIGKREYLQ